MGHPAEIVHQRQDDGVATGRKKGSNKGHHPHLHLKHPLLPSGIRKTGPEVNLPTDGHGGSKEVALALLKTSQRVVILLRHPGEVCTCPDWNI